MPLRYLLKKDGSLVLQQPHYRTVPSADGSYISSSVPLTGCGLTEMFYVDVPTIKEDEDA